MPDESISADFRARYEALTARLAAPGAAAERDRLRAEITALYRDAEQQIAALAAFREVAA